jgi:capsular polysaccharide biosynthesis protein
MQRIEQKRSTFVSNEGDLPFPSPPYGNTPSYCVDDEISLLDLWLVLIKHKKLIAWIAGIILVTGVVAALVIPKKYTYTTSVEIGSRIITDRIEPIEAPDSVLAKIQESYIPLVQRNYIKTHPSDDTVYQIVGRIPKSSQIIVLESKGPIQVGDIVMQLQKDVVEEVKQDHKRIIEIIKKEIEIKRNQAISQLEELKDAAKMLVSGEKRLNLMATLLQRQLEDAKKGLIQSEEGRKRAVKEATNEAKALTLLMLDAEMQQLRDRVDKLEERLTVEVAASQDEIVKKLADNQRSQAVQRDFIASLEAQLINLIETRSLVEPMQSNLPVGLGKKIIVILAMVVGLIVGVFAAFFAEFLEKARLHAAIQRSDAESDPSTQKIGAAA